MMQVICPGCAKLIEVGVLPAGTLPSCPFCHMVFQLPEPVSGGPSPGTAVGEGARTSASPPQRQGCSSASEAPSSGPSSVSDAVPRHKGGAGLVIALLLGCLVAMMLLLAVSLLAHREKDRD